MNCASISFINIRQYKVNLTGIDVLLHSCTFSDVTTCTTNWLIDWLTSAMWEGKSHFLMQNNQSVLQGESMATNQLLLGSRWSALSLVNQDTSTGAAVDRQHQLVSCIQQRLMNITTWHHLGLWKTEMDIFHYFLIFYRQWSLKLNTTINFTLCLCCFLITVTK